ncbi:MAG: DUF1772 domain-containing protein [Hyphomicrobiales bacterium]
MKNALTVTAFTATLLNAAIFGFFYAWICSTMWGLDAATPDIAIGAMQAMNASVRNVVFAPAFFATPFTLWIAAFLALRLKYKNTAWLFAIAGIVYLSGGLILTMAINVPMNEALALVEISSDQAINAEVWTTYSSEWQIWNITRTILSAIALTFSLVGIYMLGQKK